MTLAQTIEAALVAGRVFRGHGLTITRKLRLYGAGHDGTSYGSPRAAAEAAAAILAQPRRVNVEIGGIWHQVVIGTEDVHGHRTVCVLRNGASGLDVFRNPTLIGYAIYDGELRWDDFPTPAEVRSMVAGIVRAEIA